MRVGVGVGVGGLSPASSAKLSRAGSGFRSSTRSICATDCPAPCFCSSAFCSSARGRPRAARERGNKLLRLAPRVGRQRARSSSSRAGAGCSLSTSCICASLLQRVELAPAPRALPACREARRRAGGVGTVGVGGTAEGRAPAAIARRSTRGQLRWSCSSKGLGSISGARAADPRAVLHIIRSWRS